LAVADKKFDVRKIDPDRLLHDRDGKPQTIKYGFAPFNGEDDPKEALPLVRHLVRGVSLGGVGSNPTTIDALTNELHGPEHNMFTDVTGKPEAIDIKYLRPLAAAVQAEMYARGMYKDAHFIGSLISSSSSLFGYIMMGAVGRSLFKDLGDAEKLAAGLEGGTPPLAWMQYTDATIKGVLLLLYQAVRAMPEYNFADKHGLELWKNIGSTAWETTKAGILLPTRDPENRSIFKYFTGVEILLNIPVTEFGSGHPADAVKHDAELAVQAVGELGTKGREGLEGIIGAVSSFLPGVNYAAERAAAEQTGQTSMLDNIMYAMSTMSQMKDQDPKVVAAQVGNFLVQAGNEFMDPEEGAAFIARIRDGKDPVSQAYKNKRTEFQKIERAIRKQAIDEGKGRPSTFMYKVFRILGATAQLSQAALDSSGGMYGPMIRMDLFDQAVDDALIKLGPSPDDWEMNFKREYVDRYQS
jgi:hypothetical protein